MKRRFPSAHPLRALLACLLLLALVVPILGGCEQLFDFANEAEKRPEETGQEQDLQSEPTNSTDKEVRELPPDIPEEIAHYARLADVKASYDKDNVSFTFSFGFFDLNLPSDSWKRDNMQSIQVGAFSIDGENLVLFREQNEDFDFDEYSAYYTYVLGDESSNLVINHSETVTIPAEMFRQEVGDVFFLYAWAYYGKDNGEYNEIAVPYEMNGDTVVILTEYIQKPPRSDQPIGDYFNRYLPAVYGREDRYYYNYCMIKRPPYLLYNMSETGNLLERTTELVCYTESRRYDCDESILLEYVTDDASSIKQYDYQSLGFLIVSEKSDGAQLQLELRLDPEQEIHKLIINAETEKGDLIQAKFYAFETGCGVFVSPISLLMAKEAYYAYAISIGAMTEQERQNLRNEDYAQGMEIESYTVVDENRRIEDAEEQENEGGSRGEYIIKRIVRAEAISLKNTSGYKSAHTDGDAFIAIGRRR